MSHLQQQSLFNYETNSNINNDQEKGGTTMILEKSIQVNVCSLWMVRSIKDATSKEST